MSVSNRRPAISRAPSQRVVAISAIAYRWGFTNISHFCRQFRQHFGKAPNEVRGRCCPLGTVSGPAWQRPNNPELVCVLPTVSGGFNGRYCEEQDLASHSYSFRRDDGVDWDSGSAVACDCAGSNDQIGLCKRAIRTTCSLQRVRWLCSRRSPTGIEGRTADRWYGSVSLSRGKCIPLRDQVATGQHRPFGRCLAALPRYVCFRRQHKSDDFSTY